MLAFFERLTVLRERSMCQVVGSYTYRTLRLNGGWSINLYVADTGLNIPLVKHSQKVTVARNVFQLSLKCFPAQFFKLFVLWKRKNNQKQSGELTNF